MNLTWHIVAKDLARLRIPLAVWVVLFLAEFAVGVRLLNGSPMTLESFEGIQVFDGLLGFLHGVIGFFLVAALVFEDPLVGTTAFWTTRPISGGRLLGAKLLASLLIFGLLPVAVTLPWWLYCGFGPHQVLEASLFSLLFQVVPVSLGLLISSLTGSMSRFIMWTLLAFVAAMLGLVLVGKPAQTHLYLHGADIVVAASGRAAARTHMLYVLALAGSLGVIAHQFATRRLLRSLVMLGCVAGLLAAEATWWPLAFRDRSLSDRGSAAAELDPRITIQRLNDASLHLEPDPGAPSDTVVFGNLKVDGAPEGFLMRYDDPVFAWHWPDGRSARARGALLDREHSNVYDLQAAVPHKEPSAAAWEQTVTYARTLKAGKPKSYEDAFRGFPSNRLWDYYVEVPRQEGLRMLSDPPACTLDLRGDILEPVLQAEVPLAAGSAWSRASDGIRIARSAWNEASRMQEVLVVEHHAEISEGFNPFFYSNRWDPDSALFAVNRRLGESAWPMAYSNFNGSVRIFSVAIVWRDLRYVGPSNEVPGYPGLDQGKWAGPSYKDWFSGATLGSVRQTPSGRFSRAVAFEHFPVTPDIFSKAP